MSTISGVVKSINPIARSFLHGQTATATLPRTRRYDLSQHGHKGPDSRWNGCRNSHCRKDTPYPGRATPAGTSGASPGTWAKFRPKEPVRTGLRDLTTSKEPVRTGLCELWTSKEPARTGLCELWTSKEPVRTGLRDLTTSKEPVRTGLRDLTTSKEPVRTGLCDLTTSKEPVRTGLHELWTSKEPVRTGLHELTTSKEPVRTGLCEDRREREPSARRRASGARLPLLLDETHARRARIRIRIRKALAPRRRHLPLRALVPS
jgi:hypothetical protein